LPAQHTFKNAPLHAFLRLITVAAAAIFGAVATQTAGTPVGQAFTLLAAIAAALTPVLGREILAVGNEAKWIRSRATAEAIKSECFRFAARSGIYANADADEAFMGRRAEFVPTLSEQASQ
jgi:Protein of unknown function (DUF4231)